MLYHPDPTRFIASSGEYGALGKTLVALSNLEFAHDKFLFEMYERNRDLSIRLSRGFPRHFEKKTDFLINAVANVQELRQVPVFLTGELDLVWLQYQLDELYEVTSIIAHGSVVYIRSTPHRITWTFKRIVQTQKKTWSSHRAIAFGISVLPDVNIHGTMGRFWSSSTANSTRFFHEHGLTVSNAIPLGPVRQLRCRTGT